MTSPCLYVKKLSVLGRIVWFWVSEKAAGVSQGCGHLGGSTGGRSTSEVTHALMWLLAGLSSLYSLRLKSLVLC